MHLLVASQVKATDRVRVSRLQSHNAVKEVLL